MENNDIIELLLLRDLTRICFQIFQQLDSKTFANSRLVCQVWKAFIDHQFFELPKGKQCLQEKITSNFLNKNYAPRIETVLCETSLFDVQADSLGICVTTMNGSVFNFELCGTMKLLWKIQLCDESLQLCMSKEKVFVVTSNAIGHIFIINRTDGNLQQTNLNAHSYSIYGVRVFQDRILATAGSRGTIKFFSIHEEKLNLMHEEALYRRNGFTHLDNDGDKLVSGSVSGDVVAWDFSTGTKIGEICSKQRIMSLNVRWPLVVTCTIDRSNDEEMKGIKLFDMKKQVLLRHIKCCDYATNVRIHLKILVVCEDDFAFSENESKHTALRFWNLNQLLNTDIKMENVSNRTIRTFPKPSNGLQICSISGSAVLTTEGNQFRKRSFWP